MTESLSSCTRMRSRRYCSRPAPDVPREGEAIWSPRDAPPASGGASRGDQIASPSRGTSGAGREQYLRLRIRVHDDKLSVIDSHLVDGPLGQAQVFSAAN